MTTTYIARVPAEFADNGDYFEFDGHQYYFKLEYYPNEQFRFARLYDTAGRMVPVDADQFASMATAFDTVSDIEDQLKSQDDFRDTVSNMHVEVL